MSKETKWGPHPRPVVPTPTPPLTVASPPPPTCHSQRRRESRAGPGTPVTQPCRGEKSFAPHPRPRARRRLHSLGLGCPFVLREIKGPVPREIEGRTDSRQPTRLSETGNPPPPTHPTMQGRKIFRPYRRTQPRHLPIPYTPPPNPPFTLSMLKESQIPPQ